MPNYQYYRPINFNLGVLQASNTAPIDWSSLEHPRSRPTSALLPGAPSSPTSKPTRARPGATTCSTSTARPSTWAPLGEDVTDISQLYGFEIQQADGLSPITQLGASVDASMPTPGSLSLSFSRFFTPSITGRNTMGPLGMGWSDSWQTSLAVQSDGTVIVTEPGGVQRTSSPTAVNSRPSYFDQPGDYGV